MSQKRTKADEPELRTMSRDIIAATMTSTNC